MLTYLITSVSLQFFPHMKHLLDLSFFLYFLYVQVFLNFLKEDEIKAPISKSRDILRKWLLSISTWILWIEAVNATKFPAFIFSAKRAGDYYMFEYDPSEDALDEPVETFVPEVTPGASDFNKLDPAQVSLFMLYFFIEIYFFRNWWVKSELLRAYLHQFCKFWASILLIHISSSHFWAHILLF